MKQKLTIPLFALLCLFLFLNATIDLDNLFNYQDQFIPNYITKDNSAANPMDDKLATLGRVLFYDKTLSSNNTIACASCHMQEFAFSDPATQSVGLNGGLTGRHAMRLVNTRFADEVRFFWDERAASLEAQTTQPVQDHIEMGFSGTNGDPDINDLIEILEGLTYYEQLFTFAYGDPTITEARLQLALAQFVRSIQSFDSRFDDGLSQVNNVNQPFPNFTPEENQGKNLFLQTPANGGAGCAGCHRPPEFDIDPITLNNGVITVAGTAGTDLTNTRAPSLRDVVNNNGDLNGPLMHDSSFTSLLQVIDHYNAIPNDPTNTNLDPRLLGPGGQPQNLNLTVAEKNALIAFLGTLTGTNIYTDEKWSDPFEPNGTITIIGGNLGIDALPALKPTLTVSPNPVQQLTNLNIADGAYSVTIFNLLGQQILQSNIEGSSTFDLGSFKAGLYILLVEDMDSGLTNSVKILKQ